MGKLHELLAVEKTRVEASDKLLADAADKFKKPAAYFEGSDRSLEMLEQTDESQAVEAAARESKDLVTTVHETLDYALKYWGDAEDVLFQKNKSNQKAVANIVVGDETIVADVPVDELLGLEVRLTRLRHLFDLMPTQNAATEWVPADVNGLTGAVKTKNARVTTKTEKTMVPIVMAPATDKHPAQVKESYTDKVIGRFNETKFSGAATSLQKAEALENIDNLIAAVKQARMRANSIEHVTDKISDALVTYLMRPFTNKGE